MFTLLFMSRDNNGPSIIVGLKHNVFGSFCGTSDGLFDLGLDLDHIVNIVIEQDGIIGPAQTMILGFPYPVKDSG